MAQLCPAPGLPGDWLNAWLAAVGITVLLPDARLQFEGNATPTAVIHIDGDVDLAARLAAALPSPADLEHLSISGLKRNVTLDAYRKAAECSRRNHDWSLSSSVTDLGLYEKRGPTKGKPDNHDDLPHSPFDPGAPRGETLWTRLRRVRELLEKDHELEHRIAASLAGRAKRVEANGLGFDYRRIPAAALGSGQVRVDPAIECLAFFGLALVPVRGNGYSTAPRGWIARRGVPDFYWPVWREPLDQFAIDALLGMLYTLGVDALASLPDALGIFGLYKSVSYSKTATNDVTAALGSKRLT
jgi:hypothetical protein